MCFRWIGWGRIFYDDSSDEEMVHYFTCIIIYAGAMESSRARAASTNEGANDGAINDGLDEPRDDATRCSTCHQVRDLIQRFIVDPTTQPRWKDSSE
jgi:hypothetical protein